MHSNDDQEFTTRRFKVLSDPNRRAIIALLVKAELSVNQISRELEIERTLVSHNLRMLRDEKIVCCLRRGRESFYKVCDNIIVNKKTPVLDFECCKISFQ